MIRSSRLVTARMMMMIRSTGSTMVESMMTGTGADVTAGTVMMMTGIEYLGVSRTRLMGKHMDGVDDAGVIGIVCCCDCFAGRERKSLIVNASQSFHDNEPSLSSTTMRDERLMQLTPACVGRRQTAESRGQQRAERPLTMLIHSLLLFTHTEREER